MDCGASRRQRRTSPASPTGSGYPARYPAKEETGQPCAIRAEKFFRKPMHQTFRDLEEASIQAGVRDEVRGAAMHYLITGKRPPAGESVIPGVLPDTGIKVRPQPGEAAAPITETLIEIAIAEKNPDEVLRWYDQWEEDGVSRYLEHNLEDRVADAVVGAYPERAFTIWKERAERLINEVRPQSYETSLRYLRKLQSHMPPRSGRMPAMNCGARTRESGDSRGARSRRGPADHKRHLTKSHIVASKPRPQVMMIRVNAVFCSPETTSAGTRSKSPTKPLRPHRRYRHPRGDRSPEISLVHEPV